MAEELTQAEAQKYAESVTALANTPLFVAARLREDARVMNFAIQSSEKYLVSSIKSAAKRKRVTQEGSAKLYLFTTALAMKGRSDLLTQFQGDNGLARYRWFNSIINHLVLIAPSNIRVINAPNRMASNSSNVTYPGDASFEKIELGHGQN